MHLSEMNLDWSGLEVLPFGECLTLLDSSPIARIGLVDQGSPVILPVNFRVDGRSIVFRSAVGSKLAAAMMERPVCAEVDSWDMLGHTGWSVLAKGIAEHVIDAAETTRLDQLAVRSWSHPDIRDQWIRIRIDELSGRRVVPGR